MVTSNDIEDFEVDKLYGLITGFVAPRPIAFVSSIDLNGNVNLSPFSFFNVFSIDPLIFVFSTVRRLRDNTVKDTFKNVKMHPEVVINLVSHKMVEQMSLTSNEYESGVNEFIKAGLREVKSDKVLPPRVKEAPVSFECIVNDIKELGENGGSGALVICEAVRIHYKNSLVDSDNRIISDKIDLVARMGGDNYIRAKEDALFGIKKPSRETGIGVDALPKKIVRSVFLSGNDLGKLGGISCIPSEKEKEEFSNTKKIRAIIQNSEVRYFEENIMRLAKQYLESNQVKKAYLTLMHL
ncbi:MAG: flavin reductase family protein [Flavobacteriales bacterium]|nr:flavin reductase family protein [Flavobacteriales bacterium]